MPVYKKNSREFRLLSEIEIMLLNKFGAQAPIEAVKSFIKDSDFGVRPIGAINDLSDNKLVKVVDGTVYFINYTGGEPEKEPLSEEMKVIIKIIDDYEGELTRTQFLAELKEKGFSRKGRNLLQEAREKGLIRGVVENKTPKYIKIVEE